MSLKWLSLLLLLQLTCYFSSGRCGKVLVWPMEYSHWINMKIILEELVTRGHEVTVLKSSAAILVDPNKSPTIKFESFPASVSQEDYENFFQQLLTEWIQGAKHSFWTKITTAQNIFSELSDVSLKICKDAVLNKKLMTKLQESRFDVILADPIIPCAELVAEILNIPLVYSLRISPGYSIEKFSGKLPFPPSYVPVVMSEFNDHMTFTERVNNMLYVVFLDFWFQTFNEKKWNQFYSEALGRPTTIFETMGKADMWLIRNYWDFEFPRPLLPNFEFIGGFHCKPAKPLPKEMEEFVQSAGEHGIVLFTLGSMISNMTEERANTIASAFAQIPQKVLWKYEGKKPDTLGPNTRLYKWIPQNDLLGHPQTKAFITHGGANGVYEAIYHGIPMVGLPLFGDQPDNIAHMTVKGAAVRLDLDTVSRTDLVNALKQVINNPFYKENVMRLSTIQHDQPVKPLDRAVFWIEFVMRHKGAKHLRPAAHDLTWYQYHSLDVIGFLLACVATAAFALTRGCLFCCRKLANAGKKAKRE
uniref:UDP-glucuronosyltransferase n=1 Tax=Sus scrofa TaxID=9823 RepID=A0A8D1STZ9_PIG